MVEQYMRDRGGAGGAARWVFFVVFAAGFALVLWLVASGRAAGFDERALGFFYGLREPALTAVMRAVTFCGNTVSVFVICVALIILPGRLRVGLPVSIMTALGTGVYMAIKVLVARQRPDSGMWLVEADVGGYSFPSGHACASMILLVSLLVLVGRVLVLQDNRFAAGLLRMVFAIFAALIGLSRIYVGVHYPSDVLGGWLLAGALLVVFFALYDSVWPWRWRVTYDAPEWDAIPAGAEKRKRWRTPTKRRAPKELIRFPKKGGAWKIPSRENPAGRREG